MPSVIVRLPGVGLTLAGELVACWDPCAAIALWDKVFGGRVALARGDGCVTLGALGLRDFVAVGFGCGFGAARGISCGESSKLISMVYASKLDDADLRQIETLQVLYDGGRRIINYDL